MIAKKLNSVFYLPLNITRFVQMFLGRIIGTLIGIILVSILVQVFTTIFISMLPTFILHNISYSMIQITKFILTIYFIVGAFITIIPEFSYKRNLYKKD